MEADATKVWMDNSLSLGVLNENACSLSNEFKRLGASVDKLKLLSVTVTKIWLVHDFDVTPELSGYHYLRSDRKRCKEVCEVFAYILDNINILSSDCEFHDKGTCKVISRELTIECCTFILVVIYRSPICLADDFILEHFSYEVEISYDWYYILMHLTLVGLRGPT